MKKSLNLLSAFILSLASFFLPIMHSSAAFAAPGDNINATATIDGASLAYMDDSHFSFDDQNVESGVAFNYISTGTNHTIKFNLSFEQGSLIGNSVTAINVNGAQVDFNDLGQDQYSFIVPELTNYSISFTVTQTGEQSHTIIWGNPGVKDLEDEDALLVHGSAKAIAVYNEHGDPIPEQVWNIHNVEGGVKDGYGHIVVEPNSQVVFEFTPEYGYQLTSVSANGTPLEAQDTLNQYTFTMPDTNIHFAATFTKTSDVLDASTEKVDSGSITLSNGEFIAGTAKILVQDVELSEDKIADFEDAAGAGEIKHYLDIDLFNIFYKGKNDDRDVWANQIHNLNNEATITLKLAEGIDASNIVIVHNIDDGDEFEVIEIDSYDAATNTITFRASSFSNFAIATKVGTPETGYGIKSEATANPTSLASVVFTVAIISAGAWIGVAKSKRK